MIIRIISAVVMCSNAYSNDSVNDIKYILKGHYDADEPKFRKLQFTLSSMTEDRIEKSLSLRSRLRTRTRPDAIIREYHVDHIDSIVPKNTQDKSTVVGYNRQYVFGLEQEEQIAGYKLTLVELHGDVSPNGLGRRLYASLLEPYITMPHYCGGSGQPLWKILEDPRVANVGWLRDRPDTGKGTLSYTLHISKDFKIAQRCVLDLSQHAVIVECRTESTAPNSVRIVDAKSDVIMMLGLPIIRRTESTTKFHSQGVLVSDQISVSECSVEFDVDVPEHEFTLSHYGFPEPPGVVWEKPTPRYVWLLAAAALFIVGLVCRWALRRRLRLAPSARNDQAAARTTE